MGKFSTGVGKWADKAIDEIDDFRKAVILEFFVSVILDTPVASGRLRGNWQIASSVVTGELEVTDKSGRVTRHNVEDFVKKIPKEKDNVTFLTNNLPYAYRIEYDGWSHTKAPEGMVRKNYIRISNNLAKFK